LKTRTLITHRLERSKTIGNVLPSFCLFSLYLLKQLTFEVDILYVYVS